MPGPMWMPSRRSPRRAPSTAAASGPLAGVPFGVKDIIDTHDMPTEWGTPIHKGRQPERDAACVALSRKAGGLLLGKTVTTEFANLHPGPTRNPHDLNRTPGGSSSGSAAAVADFMVPLAIGTQTTGSTIRPASFCGVFGYRPTWGEHRMHGVMEASGSLDTLGILARSVDDVALYRDVLLGITPEPIADARPRAAHCAVQEPCLGQVRADDANAGRGRRACAWRAPARASREFELPADFARLNEAHRSISSFEFARTFTWEIEHHWDEISDTLRGGRLKDGIGGDFDRYVASKRIAEECRVRLDDLWGDIDVLLTPARSAKRRWAFPAFEGVPMFQLWTILHVPAMTLPVFKGPTGLPIGAQLLARRHDDRKLFACAQWVYRKLIVTERKQMSRQRRPHLASHLPGQPALDQRHADRQRHGALWRRRHGRDRQHPARLNARAAKPISTRPGRRNGRARPTASPPTATRPTPRASRSPPATSTCAPATTTTAPSASSRRAKRSWRCIARRCAATRARWSGCIPTSSASRCRTKRARPCPPISSKAAATAARPTVVLFDGMDNAKEMSVIFAGLDLAKRGINVLAIDGPGQSEPLRLRNIPSRLRLRGRGHSGL